MNGQYGSIEHSRVSVGMSGALIYSSSPMRCARNPNNRYSSRNFNLFNWLFKCIAFQLFISFFIFQPWCILFRLDFTQFVCMRPYFSSMKQSIRKMIRNIYWTLLNDELRMPLPEYLINNIHWHWSRAKDQFAITLACGSNTSTS